MKAASFALHTLLFASTLCLGACDPEAEHADHGGETSDEGTTLGWHEAPPAAATAAEAFSVMFMVNTTGDIHVTEVRICEGVDVADCGLGEMGTFTSVTAMEANGMYMANVTLDTAGDYTLVAYAHVGDDPHTSAGANVTAS